MCNIQKKKIKNQSEYYHMRSCYEDLIETNLTVQLDLKSEKCFNIKNHFNFEDNSRHVPLMGPTPHAHLEAEAWSAFDFSLLLGGKMGSNFLCCSWDGFIFCSPYHDLLTCSDNVVYRVSYVSNHAQRLMHAYVWLGLSGHMQWHVLGNNFKNQNDLNI